MVAVVAVAVPVAAVWDAMAFKKVFEGVQRVIMSPYRTTRVESLLSVPKASVMPITFSTRAKHSVAIRMHRTKWYHLAPGRARAKALPTSAP
jgi:hypothetical protein